MGVVGDVVAVSPQRINAFASACRRAHRSADGNGPDIDTAVRSGIDASGSSGPAA